VSEYQYIGFRAIDEPVSKTNLAYMRRQSTRARITPWSFDNEYGFGDFHGNAPEMLRRGYDIHLHYANFGVRTLMIRLPVGFPDEATAKPYLMSESIEVRKDKKGPGRILIIEPGFEPGDLEDLWDLDDLLDRLLPLRAEILAGDSRPLYLANLAAATDSYCDPDEWHEPPVPAGLDDLTSAQSALAELYALSDALLAAAARDSPPMPTRPETGNRYNEWLARQPETIKDERLAALMADPDAAVRGQLLRDFRKSQRPELWPTAHLARTMTQLTSTAEEIQQAKSRRKAAATARSRAQKLKKMASDPSATLRKAEQLVKQRTLEAYRQVALLLADLRESLTGTKDSELAGQYAKNLKANHPTSHNLTSALRKQGFLKR
jgi:hypothetical protein